MEHQAVYEKLVGKEAVLKKYNSLKASKLYTLLNRKDKNAFFERLPYFTGNADTELRQQGVELEILWYLQQNDAPNYIRSTNYFLEEKTGVDVMTLLRLAKRPIIIRGIDRRILEQALKMAQRAIALSPDMYSTYSIFAQLCLTLGKKEEGLAAIKSAIQLAGDETSKARNYLYLVQDKLNKQ